MDHLDGIKRMVEHELMAITENGKFRSGEEIEYTGKLIDIMKDICEMEDDDGMSYDYRGSYDGYGYNDGRSYARGRRYAKRDSMGRYSRDGYSTRYPRYYSRDDGNQEYIEQLRGMMDSAPDDSTRQSIQRMIDNMER